MDASVLVAVIGREEDREAHLHALAGHADRITNGVAIWEAARAVARRARTDLLAGLDEVERFRHTLSITVVPIGGPEASEAVRAQARYGKGTGHLARLNMGDCFAYACAKTNGAKLLYKGDDFIHTDLA